MHGDDTCRLKGHVAIWLNESAPTDQPLNPNKNLDMGSIAMLQADFSILPSMIGTLLSKIQTHALYVTNGPCRHHAKIRDMHPDFIVTANSWPTFLYEDYKYDLTDPTKGLFKGSILLKVCDSSLTDLCSTIGQSFKAIFILPSSVNKDEDTLVKH